MSEWKETTLGNLIDIKHGWAFKGEFFNEANRPKNVVVAIRNFNYSGGFRFDSTRIKEYLDSYPQEYELIPGDILLAMTCQTPGGEILGIPGRIPTDNRTYLHNQRLGKIEIKDEEITDPSFIYWLCLWRDFNHHLVATATGTKILHTAPERIKSFTFKCPPVDEQKQIGKTLDALDRKIENLRKQNETLEKIAQTLFKHWFVDFEFPNEDGKPYKSSGGAMVRSDLGEIPVGWRVAPFETTFLIPLRNGLTRPRSVRGEGFYMVNMGELFANKRIGDLEMDRVQLSDSEYEKSILEVGDILFARQSLVREGAGQCSIITEASEPRTFEGHLIRCRIDRKKANSFYFFYHFWSSAGGFQMRSLVEQVAAAGIRGSELAKLEVLIPPIELQEKFFSIIESSEKFIALNFRRIRTLTKTRDRILPHLMSGKLRITE